MKSFTLKVPLLHSIKQDVAVLNINGNSKLINQENILMDMQPMYLMHTKGTHNFLWLCFQHTPTLFTATHYLSKLILWWCIPPAFPRPPGCFLCLPVRVTKNIFLKKKNKLHIGPLTFHGWLVPFNTRDNIPTDATMSVADMTSEFPGLGEFGRLRGHVGEKVNTAVDLNCTTSSTSQNNPWVKTFSQSWTILQDVARQDNGQI